jgi:hypothetical protein
MRITIADDDDDDRTLQTRNQETGSVKSRALPCPASAAFDSGNAIWVAKAFDFFLPSQGIWEGQLPGQRILQSGRL